MGGEERLKKATLPSPPSFNEPATYGVLAGRRKWRGELNPALLGGSYEKYARQKGGVKFSQRLTSASGASVSLGFIKTNSLRYVKRF